MTKHIEQLEQYDWAEDYANFQARFAPFKNKKQLTKPELTQVVTMLVEEIEFMANKLFIVSQATVEANIKQKHDEVELKRVSNG